MSGDVIDSLIGELAAAEKANADLIEARGESRAALAKLAEAKAELEVLQTEVKLLRAGVKVLSIPEEQWLAQKGAVVTFGLHVSGGRWCKILLLRGQPETVTVEETGVPESALRKCLAEVKKRLS